MAARDYLHILPIIGPIYVVLLGLYVPYLAAVEEIIFRHNTDSWLEALGRSLAFGFVHMLVGVPIYGAIILSLFGLWLSYWYMSGGLIEATAYHAAHNLLLIAALLVLMLATKIHKRYNLRKTRSKTVPAAVG